MNKRSLRLISLLWALCIVTAAIIRGRRGGALLATTGLAHIGLHFGVFAVLGALFILSYDSPGIRLLVTLLAIALGCGTEIYEHLAFSGPLEFADVLVDSLGVVTGAAVGLQRAASLSR
jgi:hypothetical protein